MGNEISFSEAMITALLGAVFSGWMGYVCGQVAAEERHRYTPHFQNRACVQVDSTIFCQREAVK